MYPGRDSPASETQSSGQGQRQRDPGSWVSLALNRSMSIMGSQHVRGPGGSGCAGSQVHLMIQWGWPGPNSLGICMRRDHLPGCQEGGDQSLGKQTPSVPRAKQTLARAFFIQEWVRREC